MNTKYLLHLLRSIPFIPTLYLQAKRVRKEVPELPEASGPEGLVAGPAESPTLRLCVIGESTMAGIGVQTHEEGFSGALARELAQLYNRQVDWKVYAKSGYTARQIRQLILPNIPETDFDILVLGIGANDAFTLNTPAGWKKEVNKLLQELRARFPYIPIVFGNMPPIWDFPAFTPLMQRTIGGLIEILGEELAEIVKEWENVHYRDERISLAGWNEKFGLNGTPEEYFSDGVHPSKLTYQIWAKDVAQGISKDDLI